MIKLEMILKMNLKMKFKIKEENMLLGNIALQPLIKSLVEISPTNALHSALNYLSYTNIFTRAFSIVKWWIIQGVYGIANATSQFMNSMLSVGNFVNQVNGKGTIGQFMRMGQKLAPLLMVICLIWIAIKIMVDHHAPKIKNVLIQLFISAFLITNIGPVTSWLTDQSIQLARGLLDTTTSSKKIAAGTSALPFDVLKDHTNDLEYMIDTNFKGTNVSSANPTSKAPAKLHWGLNDLSRSSVDHGEVNFTEVLDNEKIKDNSALEKKDHPYKKGDYDKTPGTHFLYGWLKYTANNTPKKNGKGSTWIAEDIWHLLGFSIGGYMRYTINFLPVLICLLSLSFAYIFAGYAIIKSFIDIVVMDILATVIFGTDLDTGQKTKRVLSSICSAVLLVSLQAFELAFYQAACTWADKSITNAWGFTMFLLAATIMLITGNEKVSQFFNVDTGAQHGWRAAGSVAYGARQLGRLGVAALGAPVRVKNMANRLGQKLNTSGSIRREANEQAKKGARQNAINKMAGFDMNGNTISQETDANDNPIDGLPRISQIPSAKKQENKMQDKAAQVATQEQKRPNKGHTADPFGASDSTTSNARGNSSVPKTKAPIQKQTNPEDLSDSAGRKPEGEPSSNNVTAFSNSPLSGNTRPQSKANTFVAKNPTDRANFINWKNRARQYDHQNHLTHNNPSVGAYSPVDYNPLTSAPYTYDEWRDNVNDVRINDVPNQNLDGSDFTASNNLVKENRLTDTPNSSYVHKKVNTSVAKHKLPNDYISKSKPPRAKK